MHVDLVGAAVMWPLCPTISEGAIEWARRRYQVEKPFPHVVLDDWFQERALLDVERAYDRANGWHVYEDGKRGNMTVREDPFFVALNSQTMLRFLEHLTGLSGLVSDPTMRGGGLHTVQPGGRLGIHVDFNRHKTLPLKRTLNTILYMNREWRPDWNGALTLTDRQGGDKHIWPIFNRWVIFGYGAETWHGHPEPLACPDGVERRSVAIYYYTPLAGELAFTGTHYA